LFLPLVFYFYIFWFPQYLKSVHGFDLAKIGMTARIIDQCGYTPVFIDYGIMPLIAAGLMLFAMGPLRPLPKFQYLREKSTKE